MRIILLSDTHGLHDMMINDIPKGDVLIHAGDCTNMGTENDISEFVNWFQNIKGFNIKIFIAGNHDWGFYHKHPWLLNYINDENLSQSDCTYLEDTSFTIETPEFSRPIKFYGSPWQPDFYNWAFNVPRSDLHIYWEKIPIDTDVLITHGPPRGIGDLTLHHSNEGCISLRSYVEKIKPVLHIFGHIHESYGAIKVNETTYINASTCNRRYVPSNKPIIVDLIEVNGKLISNIITE